MIINEWLINGNHAKTIRKHLENTGKAYIGDRMVFSRGDLC